MQKGFGAEQAAALNGRFQVEELGDELDPPPGGFRDTAAVMCCLDLVVTADTAAAHLAGALGVPVWIALSTIVDWRWQRDRDDTPWYPTMRLFRQRRLGDWDEVFIRIAEALRAQLAKERKRLIFVEVAPGELLDKITILEIKSTRITDPTKLRHVQAELAALRESAQKALTPSDELTALVARLRSVNDALWEIEDAIRERQRAQDFGAEFIQLAQSVIQRNTERSELKRQINELLGAPIFEQKQYA